MTTARMWERVSGDQQEERNQTRDLTDWCDSHGYDYDPSDTYRAHAKSAYKGEHAKLLRQALRDMRDGRYTVLVVWRSDRIDREEKLGEHIAEAESYGGKIEFVKDPELNDLTGLSGRIMTVIKSYGNWEYSHKIGESVGISFDRIDANEGIRGRATYGYRIEGDKYNKTFVPEPSEARVIKEATERYLGGETIEAICSDLDARGVPSPTWRAEPGTHWHPKTLAGLLRSTAIAGRKTFGKSKTTVRFEPIIMWDEHRQLVARLDSRAYRKGISPGNVALLTSILSDDNGHHMWRKRAWDKGHVYYCAKCHIGVNLADMDERVSAIFESNERPYLVQQRVPGDNHEDKIARLRLDRAELDDLADDYDQEHARLTAQIRRLAKEDQDNPQPETIKWVDTGKTYGDVWAEMTTAQRRDMMLDAGVTVTWFGEDRWEFDPGSLPNIRRYLH